MLQSGFTPEFDIVGGEMAEVVSTVSRLPPEDLAAITADLKVVPPVESEAPPAGAGDP